MDATAIDLIGPAVTQYDFDQNGTEMALSARRGRPVPAELMGGRTG